MVPHTTPPAVVVRPNPRIKNMLIVKRNPFTERPIVPWHKLPHIRSDKLPQKATDIRGIDAAGHQVFSRKQVFGKIPKLSASKYFSVTFIPANHVIGSLRKSNIAYTFTNYGGHNLNDQTLQKCFTEYRGKYKSLGFFKTIHSPMGTAVSRCKLRRLVKEALFKALHEVIPNTPTEVAKVAGIFHFKFQRYPAGREKQALRADINNAVVRLYTNTTLSSTLASVSKQSNRDYRNVRMLVRDIRPENAIGADSTPGYYPKLPFLGEDVANIRKSERRRKELSRSNRG
ncbi:hypothetical protein JCM33374_g4587 [Metschnikowia sp. JCM 33374]|nr:hypothetical protein JCM33374_g4587 [Metschnikowia sp. JCM 33374]